MESGIRVRALAANEIDEVASLWEALFDHHLAVGAAGLATIAREETWPRRRAHYERLLQQHPDTRFWIALDDAGSRLGYAVAFEEELAGARAMVLETLGVAAAARGRGIGSHLMRTVDDAAQDGGIDLGVLDVLGGNTRARALYVRCGYEPYSETWMLSTPPVLVVESPPSFADLVQEARRLGLRLTLAAGPDDTWVSADQIVDLSRPRATGLRRVSGPPAAARSPIDLRGLEDLCTTLADTGLWTIRCEISSGPTDTVLRGLLAQCGFRLSTERLLRRDGHLSTTASHD